MKLSIFTNPNFFTSLSKLMTHDKIPLEISYRLKTVRKAIEAECVKYEELRTELVKKYAEKDEKGEVIYKSKGGPASFSLENEKLFNEKFKELQSITFKPPMVQKITLKELKDWGVPLNANDLYELEDLVQEPTEAV